MQSAIKSPNEVLHSRASHQTPSGLHVSLLTGGDDRPYALGLASALAGQGIDIHFVASDKLDAPQMHESPHINFINLRGDQSEDAPVRKKVVRLLRFYFRLLRYAARAEPRLFHILWNNRLEMFDRTLLMLYYRLLGKRIIFTAHNVNKRKRDGCDSRANRLTLGIQYRLCDHILVHTPRMKKEMVSEFGVSASHVTIIPFGINNTVPKTQLTRAEARASLGISPLARTALFFGQIAPYKGLKHLIEAFTREPERTRDVILIIAGKVKQGAEAYWNEILCQLQHSQMYERIIAHVRFIPDEEVERYFKAADVVVLPYVDIFQSGVPFLAYSFGVPVIATDVGSLREDVIEGKTGFICPANNPHLLAATIEKFFASPLYGNLERARDSIRSWANEQHSWSTVATITEDIYKRMLEL